MTEHRSNSNPQGVAPGPELSGGAAHPPGRTLCVWIPHWDGSDSDATPPPKVGAVLAVRLALGAAPDPGDLESTTRGAIAKRASTRLRAVAYSEIGQRPHLPRDGGPWWPTVLRGDGWSARYDAERPMTGHVQVRGILIAQEYGADEVRGLATRVQAITTAWRPNDADSQRHESVPGSVRFTDVAEAPFSARGSYSETDCSGAHLVQREGALVDLDLDIPPANPRPRLVAGALAAHEKDLWVIDRELPLLAHVHDVAGARKTTEHILPLSIVDPDQCRSIVADSTGCWVAGHDGVHRVEVRPNGGTDVTRLDDQSAVQIALCNGALLAIGNTEHRMRRDPRSGHLAPLDILDHPARILVPGRDPAPVDLPTGTVDAVTATDGGFVLLLTVSLSGPEPRGRQLVSITTDGAVQVGPILELDSNLSSASLSPNPLRLCTRKTVYRVLDDLTVEPIRPVSHHRLRLGLIAERPWTVTYRPRGIGRRGWWPGTGPDDMPPGEAGQWLFVLLDRDSDRPTTVVPLSTPLTRPSATADGTVWLADGAVTALRPDGSVDDLDLAFDDPSLGHRLDGLTSGA